VSRARRTRSKSWSICQVSDERLARAAWTTGRAFAAPQRRLAADIVNELALEPPIDPSLIASYQGISRIERAELPCAACLLQVDGRFVIKVRASDGDRRRRFSAFHEVGHTFMPGYWLQTQFRCNPSIKNSTVTEVLCDQAASEFLLPSSFFDADARVSTFSMTAVAALRDRYVASEEATARRLVEFWPEDAALIRLEFCTHPSRGSDEEPTWRVRYFHPGSGHWPFVPQWKALPGDFPVFQETDSNVLEYEGDLVGLSSYPIRGIQLSATSQHFVNQQGEVSRSVTAIIRRPGVAPDHS
jgi:hypothetical protein